MVATETVSEMRRTLLDQHFLLAGTTHAGDQHAGPVCLHLHFQCTRIAYKIGRRGRGMLCRPPDQTGSKEVQQFGAFAMGGNGCGCFRTAV